MALTPAQWGSITAVPWIDVSIYQFFPPGGGTTSWRQGLEATDYAKAGQRGVQAVSLRIGSGRGVSYNTGPPYVGGSPLVDPTFAEANRRFRAAGMRTLGYWWLDPDVDVDLQADLAVAEVLRSGGIDGPIVPDVEDTGPQPPPAQWRALLERWFDRVQQGWSAPLLYTGGWWWNVHLAGYEAAFADRQLVAAYYAGQSGTPAEQTPLAERPPSDASRWRDWAFTRSAGAEPAVRGWSTWSAWQFTSKLVAGDFGFVTGLSGLDGDLATSWAFNGWFNDVTQLVPPVIDGEDDDMKRLIAGDGPRKGGAGGFPYLGDGSAVWDDQGGVLVHIDGQVLPVFMARFPGQPLTMPDGKYNPNVVAVLPQATVDAQRKMRREDWNNRFAGEVKVIIPEVTGTFTAKPAGS